MEGKRISSLDATSRDGIFFRQNFCFKFSTCLFSKEELAIFIRASHYMRKSSTAILAARALVGCPLIPLLHIFPTGSQLVIHLVIHICCVRVSCLWAEPFVPQLIVFHRSPSYGVVPNTMKIIGMGCVG